MKKILVIDDQPENIFYLQDRLQKEGFAVISANGGRTGIEAALTQLPDLILLDIMMPEISGLEVCRFLVNDSRTSRIPIILVTAKISAEDMREGLQAGAVDYIKKPINKIELLARVNSALKVKESQDLFLEVEKMKTFTATVVTANHKIKQPLTLIKLSLTAIKRELHKEEINKEAITNKTKYIDIAVGEINDILEQLNQVEKPIFADYVGEIKMIDLGEGAKPSK
ncbi:MAG: response regulator [Ignavibacteria bacterium CG_4_8_14_3_um_filter_37_9]|nr:response regulator [Ignavibacteria bacterium]OIO21019.1 MAG: response regulator [Ignavibacteria bacterium CG1_02_37_35]PIP79238.1 MAG: response regulator [Ignavibacteria bacterium CG22_combo_CG10-13_8_21_14_all_37_15]PIS45840.1 MAG: response regulator [Ignavibacteria bacterium CG08_land_8_20_14_0_20_37_9]PIW99786.1 MAG: response regulator [Ignavibacteria bacterium CG_4_8_14_3_um_filter_37_9]PIX95075.1 MAG: response regulator [Ignavibacteria bacterium CG_4_10_14_3_um_filter_37_18]PJC61152.1